MTLLAPFSAVHMVHWLPKLQTDNTLHFLKNPSSLIWLTKCVELGVRVAVITNMRINSCTIYLARYDASTNHGGGARMEDREWSRHCG